ncbi:myosin light chain kinase 2, skeletal/cardiac muscle isoform 1-T3 [Vipera latastei]
MEKDGETSSVQDSGGGGENVLPEGPAQEKEKPTDQGQAEKEGSPGESQEVKDHPGDHKDDQQKPLHIQHSFSCPAKVNSLGDIPEETPAAPSAQSPEEPAAGSPSAQEPTPGETPKPEEKEGSPDQVPGPAAEPPSPATQESDRTLAEESLCPAPEAAGVSPSPGSEETASSAEPGSSPYLTPDFGKEDPSLILDDTPPPPAPFTHRIVTLRTGDFKDIYKLNTKEVLGGGKFGEVRRCTVKDTDLKLAVKIIKKQGPKDRETAEAEIDVMNQLNHRNLIQLYDAIETPREIMLFMEFVEGGELFERIIDEDYQLTEVDCMVFVRQICEGILFMHHMRVVHLDLKPENILCVTSTGHMVKIIDFGFARR